MELQSLSHTKVKYKPLNKQKTSTSRLSTFQSLFFIWAFRIIKKGYHSDLSYEDTQPLPEQIKSKNQNIKHYLKTHGIIASVFFCYKRSFMLLVFLNFIQVFTLYTNPVIVKVLLWYIQLDKPPLWIGLLIILSYMFIAYGTQILQKNFSLFGQKLKTQVSNGLKDAIVEKVLKVRSKNDGNRLTLLQTDAKQLNDCFLTTAELFRTPIQLIFSFLFVYNQIGVSILAGIASVFIILFINYFLVKCMKKLDEKKMGFTDERTRISNQALSEIKMIKAFASQSYFYDKIMACKMKQIHIEKLKAVLRHCLMNLILGQSGLISFIIVLFMYVVILGQNLTPQQCFVILLSMQYFQNPIQFFTNYASTITRAQISSKRIKSFLNSPNIQSYAKSDKIIFNNSSFSYQIGQQNVLQNIDIQIKQGSFVAIVGPVASGKSTILNAILNQLVLNQGQLKTPQSISFAPSLDNWIMNTTLRENILMGNQFNQDWFWKVVNACGLIEDINSLPGKDMTEIGEKGINLSGGQKSRVCLARAVYSDKETILMDDSLSSVDTLVASQILKKCILGLLKHKTRVLVTHRLEFATKADLVVQMNQGKIKRCYKPEQIQVLDEQIPENQVENAEFDELIPQQRMERGRIDKNLYWKLLQYIGSVWPLIFFCFFMIIQQSNTVFSSMVLKDWGQSHQSYSTLKWYIYLCIIGALISNLNSLMAFFTIQAVLQRVTHSKMLISLFKAPINLFFDITPSGRVLNRLGADQSKVQNIWGIFNGLIFFSLNFIAKITVQTIFFPQLILAVPLIIYSCRTLTKYFIKTSLQLQRIDANSNSQILSSFNECLSGSKIIRCFKKEKRFQKRCRYFIDRKAQLEFNKQGVWNWFQMNINFVAITFIVVVVVFIVYYAEEISVGTAGVCLVVAFGLPGRVFILVMVINQIQNQMVAFERIQNYIQITPEIQSDKTLNQKWSSNAEISFVNVWMSYRSDTPMILKGVSFTVFPGTRVGLIGKTGSGKSSLFMSILRIVEIEQGEILIGGQNISFLNLEFLRKSITYIPQDPLVFQDTLRNNLDFKNEFDEKKIEEVLQSVSLDKYGLDFDVKDKGQNLSVGERQFISIARSLLFRNKVVLVDEATAGVDPKNDSKIQQLLRNSFEGCTMMVIAHRLNTVMDSDQIFVMEDGKVVEIGTPEDLLKTESKFREYVEEQGNH